MSATDTHYVHPQGLCESASIGPRTRVWAFAHVLEGAVIGADCNICDHVFVENNVYVGDRVTVKSGVQLWDGIRLEDDAFVGPNATFTNDPFPRSRAYLEEYPVIVVREGASLGANCTVLPGVTIARGAMVGAGAVVTRDVPPHAIVVGNPARIVGYTDTRGADGAAPEPAEASAVPSSAAVDGVRPPRVGGAALHKLTRAVDMRGTLVAAEAEREVPFVPKRAFMVMDVPSKDVRGEHAHRRCEQFLICLAGSVAVVLDNGSERDETVLGDPSIGLYLPPMVWSIQYRYSANAVLLVLASRPYEADDYIRDYDEFLALTS